MVEVVSAPTDVRRVGIRSAVVTLVVFAFALDFEPGVPAFVDAGVDTSPVPDATVTAALRPFAGFGKSPIKKANASDAVNVTVGNVPSGTIVSVGSYAGAVSKPRG